MFRDAIEAREKGASFVPSNQGLGLINSIARWCLLMCKLYGLTTGSTGGFAGGKSPPGVLGNFELAA